MRAEEYADLIRANKQLSDKARQSHDEPKPDCIFYDAGQDTVLQVFKGALLQG